MMGLPLRGSVGHAFGNPLEEKQQQPPKVGVQPFSGIPYKA
jgi:hypothetical protein